VTSVVDVGVGVDVRVGVDVGVGVDAVAGVDEAGPFVGRTVAAAVGDEPAGGTPGPAERAGSIVRAFAGVVEDVAGPFGEGGAPGREAPTTDMSGRLSAADDDR
jgi:hypothetical protein